MKTLFIGQTRFSLYIPNSMSWNLARSKSEDEYMKALYADERLGPRMDIFENLSVPQLALAAEDHHVVHYVQYSSSLPEKYQTRLRALAEKYDFLELYVNDSQVQHSELINRAAKERLENERGLVSFAWYRLDDDDILGKDFFKMAEPYVTPEHAGYVLSFGRGYTTVYMDGSLWDLRELYRPKTSVGQMYICSFDSEIGRFIEPPRQDHAQIDKWAPTILDSRSTNFITMLHPNQDGHQRGGYTEAIGRIFREQQQLPLASNTGAFSDAFPVIARSLQKEEDVVFDARGMSETQATQLGTETTELEFRGGGEFKEVEFAIRLPNAVPGERVFMGLRFDEGIPGDFDETKSRWKKFGNDILVIGFPVKALVQQRVVIEPELTQREPKLIFWHSKGLANEAVLLEFVKTQGASLSAD